MGNKKGGMKRTLMGEGTRRREGRAGPMVRRMISTVLLLLLLLMLLCSSTTPPLLTLTSSSSTISSMPPSYTYDYILHFSFLIIFISYHMNPLLTYPIQFLLLSQIQFHRLISRLSLSLSLCLFIVFFKEEKNS